jgi:hypothetical protein
MKKTLLLLTVLVSAFSLKGQTFWLENWVTETCLMGCTSYTGSNGTWVIDSIGINGTAANAWFFSETEGAMGRDKCGGLNSSATMHIGNVSTSPAAPLFCPTGDCGAAYDGSPSASILTNIRAKSPVINCNSKSNIYLSFNYIMGGRMGHDYGLVWYYNGSVWDTLAKPPITPVCGTEGKWSYFSIALPSSSNNNSNVQLAFSWTNDSAGYGNDPSFAVDSIELSVGLLSGINGAQANERIKLFPNPSNGIFNLEIKNYKSGIKNTIEVYNTLGERVYQLSNNDNTLNLKGQPPGVYLYRIFNETGNLISSGKLEIR